MMTVSGVGSDLHCVADTATVGLDAKQENIIRAVDDGVFTQVSIKPPIEEQSTMRMFFDVASMNIRCFRSHMSQELKIIYAGASLKTCEGSNKSIVDQLLRHFPRVRDTDRKNSLRLVSLHIVEGCAKVIIRNCSPKGAQYLEVIVSAAFESLPGSVLSAMRSRVSSDLSEISYEKMQEVILDVYQTLPSVSLKILEKKISGKGNEIKPLRIIQALRRVTVSDLEPEVTEDFIKQEVLRISQLARR